MRIVTMGGRASALVMIDGTEGRDDDLTCVVEVTDAGSSTGVIRRHLHVPAPGDIRSALARLAAPPPNMEILHGLMEYRVEAEPDSELHGMAFGNLLLAALTLYFRDFHRAVEELGRALRTRGLVLPVSNANVHLAAELEDGSTVHGEVAVRGHNKPPVKRLFLEGEDAELLPHAAEAIAAADVIVLGPGSLYTSVLPCLIVPGVPEALAATRAHVTFVANNTTSLGQTEHMSFLDHIHALTAVVGDGVLDSVIINSARPTDEMISAYGQIGLRWIDTTDADLQALREMGITPVLGDLTESGWHGVRSLHKVDTIRHDPARLRDVVGTLVPLPSAAI